MKTVLSYVFIVIILGNFLIADVRAVRAQESAERVINVLENKEFQIHLTLDLMNIARNGHLLEENEKNRLRSLGFDFTGNKVVMKSVESQHSYDSQHFRIHYDLTDFHAVDPTDSDNSGIPDYVETMASVFEDVYYHDIIELGYVPPPSDGLHGGNDLYDIYIVKTNAYGFTNYIESTWGDNPNSPNVVENNAYASYIKMRNSYEGFAEQSELESIQVTAAHEFFHAIQLGYDGDEELWMLEASATWMEEEHYDDVNDCYQYLIPRFEDPQYSIRSISGLVPYGSFILFKYIDEHLGGNAVIRRAWEYSRQFDSLDDDYSIEEIDRALREKGHSFKKALTNMAIANCILSDDANAGMYAYEEAQAYQDFTDISYGDTLGIELAFLDTIDFKPDTSITKISNRLLQPYAAQYLKINTEVPLKVSLGKYPQNPTSIKDLGIHAIRKTIEGVYYIDSGTTINIDPKNDTEWLYLVVISTDDIEQSVFSYQLVFSNGKEYDPEQFEVKSLYPYPFESFTTIKIDVIEPQFIDVIVYNLLGQKIKKLDTKYFNKGYHELIWDGNSDFGKPVSSGVYFIKLEGQSTQTWQKITLVK